MTYIILTNNKSFDTDKVEIQRVEGDFECLLEKARDLVHIGYKLEVSPLPASHRMLFSPVRTLILSKGNIPDEESNILIERDLEKYRLTMGERKADFKNLEDYEFVDRDLAMGALEELGIK